MSVELRILDNNCSKSSLNVLQNDLSKMDKSELIQLHINLQTRLNKLEDTDIDLRAQLLSVTEERDAFERETLTGANLKQVQEQIKQKDLRIDEMNNLILAKERQIIDLQEMCTEQGQVAHSKSLAVHIVNRRLQELDAKQVNDVATETTDLFDITGSNTTENFRRNRSRSPHRSSPGRAFPQLRLGGNSSPPPVDPAEDGCSSYTTETQQNLDGTFKKKQRKKVNFNIDNKNDADFSPPQIQTPTKKQIFPSDYEELITENDHLRQIIREMEEALQFANKASKPESLTVLKVKAVAQAKIRELEGMLSQKGTNKEEKIAELKAVVEQLKDSREWVLNENAKLQDQLECSKQKCNDLIEEMDSSLKTTDLFRKKLDDNVRKMDATIAELYQARAQVRQVVDEKAILTSEIERLKEAIFAQDEFIGVLEGDLLVYEAHVGILRDSIGASKKEDRQYIKSKAFSAKINALEAEKEEISKKNNEEKLRAKAFAVKIRCLEQERDELKLALRHYESGHQQRSLSAGISNISQQSRTELCSVSTMTNDDFKQNDVSQSEQQLSEQLLEKTEQYENLLIQLTEQKEQNQLIVSYQNDLLNDLNELLFYILKLNNTNADDEDISAKENSEDESGDLENIDIFSNFIQKFSQIKNAFDETNNKLNSIKQYAESLIDQLENNKEEIDLLKSKNEQQEEIKLKIEFELKSSWQKYTESLNLIDNNDKTIKDFEEKIVNLSNELSSKKNEILELGTENKVLEEEKTSLKQNIYSIEQLVGSLRRENASSQNKIVELNEKSISLSSKLTEEKNRLEKLVNLLNSIVDKFKSNIFPVNEMSLDEFINEGIENSKEEFKEKEENINKINYLQNNNEQLENEIANLKIQLTAAEAYAEDLLNQKSALEIERVALLSERNNLLPLQNELFECQNKNKKLVEELGSLNEIIKNNQMEDGIAYKPVFVDFQTQTELIKMSNKYIQSTNMAENLIDAQIQCEFEMKTFGVETDEQKKILFSDVAVGDDKISEDFIVSSRIVDDEIEKQKINLIQQQSHQLLKECIQDRQEFERDMDINVQQLLELKNSLETSVEVLKGEVWALNAEIKRRFAEQNSLKNSLEQVGNVVIQLRSENEILTNTLKEKDEELSGLKNKLEYFEENEKIIEEKNKILCSSIEKEVNKTKKLQNLLILFNEKNAEEMSSFRYQLQQLKELQIEAKGLLLEGSSSCFNQLFEYVKQVKEHKCASNLTIKNRDNDALVRENNELIMTNARLQNELDQISKTFGDITEEIKEEDNLEAVELELRNDSGYNNNLIVNKTSLLQKESVDFRIILPSNNEKKIIENKNNDVNEEEKLVEGLWYGDANTEDVDDKNKDLNKNNDWGDWNDEDNEDGYQDDKIEENNKEKEENEINSNKEEFIKSDNIVLEQKVLEEDWAWNDDNDQTLSSKMDNDDISTQHSSSSNQNVNVVVSTEKDVKSLFDDWDDF